jgi:alpha-1,2-mannosyltransferase
MLTRRITAAGQAAAVATLAVAAALFLRWYGNKHNYFDLRIYVSAMRWWAGGHPLYDYAQPDRVQGELYFTYPPFTALVLRPFAAVPIRFTIGVFIVGTAIALAITTWWLVAPLADRYGMPRWFAAGLAIPLVFVIEPTRETFTLGQINMLLIVLLLADLLFAVPRASSGAPASNRASSGAPASNGWRWAGVGIGLATALKLFPGIFIVYLLVTRRWRAAAVASATAAGATLFAAAVAPHASWQFWTNALWDTGRVGRTDYTGNQSLLGLLSRLVAPHDPNRLIWVVLAAAAAGYGLWRARRAAAAGDELTGMTLTGLVGSLISPITWPHHVYWFIPAVVLLVDGVLRPAAVTESAAQLRRLGLLATAIGVYACALYGVVSFVDYGTAKAPTVTIEDFVLRNLYVLVMLALLVVLPVRVRSSATTPMPVYNTFAAK